MTVKKLSSPLEIFQGCYGIDAIDSLYVHKKTGHVYYIIDVAYLEKDLKVAVIYKKFDNNDYTLWIRPMTEFFDGRFVQLNDEEARNVST